MGTNKMLALALGFVERNIFEFNMVKTIFNYRAILIPSILFIFFIVGLLALVDVLMKPISENILDALYLPLFMCVAFALGLLHEFRNKVIEIKIVKTQIEKKTFFRFNEVFHFQDFDGFQIRNLKGKYEDYEYLYLVKNNKKIITLSQTYHDNYYELKNVIIENSKNLGISDYNIFLEIKDILLFR